VYTILRQFFGAIAAAALAATLALCPPVLAWVGAVIKDTWLGVALLAGWALLLLAARCLGRRSAAALLAASFASLWLATASRHAALPAVLPALCIGASLALRGAPEPVWLPVRYRVAGHRALTLLAGGLLAGVVTLSTDLLTYRVLGAAQLHPEQATFAYDLARLSVREQRLLLSPAWFPLQDLGVLATIADRRSGAALFFNPPPAPNVNFSTDPAQVSALRADWETQVRAHPVDYLAVRSGIYRTFLGLPGETVCASYQAIIPPNQWNFSIGNEALHRAVNRYVALWNTSLLFRPWVYLALTFAGAGLLVWPRRSRTERILGAMSLSSTLYTLSFFFLTPACDYRYNWYSYVCGLLVACVLLRGAVVRLRQRRQRLNVAGSAA